MTVATIANSIAPSFSTVGLVVKRVSTVADRESPCGAGPLRSVKTPTKLGRRLGSANPLRNSFCGSVGSLIPGKVANVPASDDVISRRVHSGPKARYIGMVATTTLRSVTIDSLLVDLLGDGDEQPVERGVLGLGRRGAQHGAAAAIRHVPQHLAGHGDRQVDRRQRDQRRGHAVELPGLRPVHRRGRLHDGQQRCQHGQDEADQACDHRHPPGGLRVRSQRVWIAHESVSSGRARIGPRRVQPRTVWAPWSTVALGAVAAGTIRS